MRKARRADVYRSTLGPAQRGASGSARKVGHGPQDEAETHESPSGAPAPGCRQRGHRPGRRGRGVRLCRLAGPRRCGRVTELRVHVLGRQVLKCRLHARGHDRPLACGLRLVGVLHAGKRRATGCLAGLRADELWGRPHARGRGIRPEPLADDCPGRPCPG